MDGLRDLLSQYDVVSAFVLTIKLTVAGGIGAALIGLVVAVLRVSPVGVLQKFGLAYVTLIRNTPLTLIVFFCCFGMLNILQVSLADPRSATSLADNNFRWAVIALAVYHASFVAEAIRSGINTVPQGQAEAARAVGLGFGTTLSTIILPQALRGAVAPLGNVLIALTKNTTVVATVGIADPAALMRSMIEFDSSKLFTIFFIMALGFVILTLPVGILATWLSRRLVVQR